MAFVTGDYAKGKDTGIIDLVLVGEVDLENLRDLVAKVEKRIKRKIRTLVLTVDEYQNLKRTLQSGQALWLWKENQK